MGSFWGPVHSPPPPVILQVLFIFHQNWHEVRSTLTLKGGQESKRIFALMLNLSNFTEDGS